jgi:hypothetical protein
MGVPAVTCLLWATIAEAIVVLGIFAMVLFWPY